MRIILFDVDGTLTLPMKEISDEMIKKIRELKLKGNKVGIVGGSNLEKIKKQIGETLFDDFDYVFVENGTTAYFEGKLIHSLSILKYLGEENYQFLINLILKFLCDTFIPLKRSNFIELRNGCINVSPIGRDCNYDERICFYNYDNENEVRKNLILMLKPWLKMFKLKASIGGMISFDIFPKGWDKTYCLKFLEEFDEIVFYGDKTEKGGNDYEIYSSNKVKGFKVSSPSELIQKLEL